MRNTEQSKKDIITLNLGTDFDSNPDFAGARKGFVKDLHNMSIREDNQNFFSVEKIKGETKIYGTLTTAYQCIGACEVQTHTVSIWCPISGVTVSDMVTFEIDGVVMVETEKLDFDINHPLQIDVDDSCIGGQFVMCDFKNPPLIFNLQDILDNYGTTTYTTDFNLNEFLGVLNTTQNHFVFDSLLFETGNGLALGQYSYSIRYADQTGNRTSWSVATPLIPVPAQASVIPAQSPTNGTESEQYPYTKTYGGVSSMTVASNYKIKLRVRIINVANYEYVEVRRASINNSLQLDAIPDKIEYRKWINDANGLPIDIIANNNSVLTIIDDWGNTDWITMTDTEDTDSPQSDFVAKSPRYYNNRLVYMNIKYPSMDLEALSDDIFIDGTDGLGFPVVEALGKVGMKDIYNQVYHKHLQTGEKYGWGVQFYDSNGSKAMVVPIKTTSNSAMINFQQPNRRAELLSDSLKYSVTDWKGACTCATIKSNNQSDIKKTYEVFDLNDAIQKTDSTTAYNILDNDPYNSLKPTKDSDSAVAGHNFQINTYVYNNNYTGATPIPYNPYGFAPNYFVTGMAFYGIDASKLPSWVKSFSIVRTKRAKRVVAQGIGFYQFNDIKSKSLDTISFFSVDVENDIFSLQDVIDSQSEGTYSVQLVSPLGIFSEIYNGDYDTFHGEVVSSEVDLIAYARILRETGNINPTDSSAMIGYGNDTTGDGYVSFGKWRNTVQSSVITNETTNEYKFKIQSITPYVWYHWYPGQPLTRPKVYDIKLQSKIYNQAGCANTDSVIGGKGNPFNEPVYIVNIIQEVDVPINNNISEYVETGHLQKLSTLIGVGNNAPQILELVDERWEDCISNIYTSIITSYGVVVLQNSYILVNNKKWLNITYKSAHEVGLILISFAANGYYIDTSGVTIYGVYTNDNVDFSGRTFSLNFNSVQNGYTANTTTKAWTKTFLTQYSIPQANDEIIVQYDSSVPIKVFVGDTVVGENVGAIIDEYANSQQLEILLPYPLYYLNINYDLGVPSIKHQIALTFIRQLVCMFTGESRINTPLVYGDTFPNIHYVMRPLHGGTNVTHPDYENDYPGENLNYGGFHFLGSFNTDYAKQLNDKINVSKPKLGYKEVTDFCSRIIWSEPKAINSQDTQNLKTIKALSIFDISDKMGAIKYAYENESDKGNNLFAITEKGIALLLTDKNILTDITGNALAFLQRDSYFIKDQYWLSKSVGCPDELWRGIAEYNNVIFIPNRESIWKLEGLTITDIGRQSKGTYYGKLYPALQQIQSGYLTPMSACYDTKHLEYWLNIDNRITIDMGYDTRLDLRGGNLIWKNYIPVNKDILRIITTTPIFPIYVILPTVFTSGQYLTIINDTTLNMYVRGADLNDVLILPAAKKRFIRDTTIAYGWTIDYIFVNPPSYIFSDNDKLLNWMGTFDYNFEKMLSVKNITGYNNVGVLGFRQGETYELNKGDYINELPVVGETTFVVAPELGITKELIDMTINSNVAPSSVQVSTKYSTLPECTVISFRNYTNAFYCQVPRKLASPYDRVQNKSFVVNVIHTTVGDFIISSIETGYSVIK
jgi:hypothetical protein